VHPDKRLFFCNVDFDAGLASGCSPRQKKYCLEAQFYYFLCGSGRDRILVDAVPDPAYLPYLAEQGIDAPRRCCDGELLPEHVADPWGWTASAVERFHRHGAQIFRPPPDSVRKVNSRRFCHRVAARHDLGIAGSTICESAGEARRRIRRGRSFPLVLKPEHGNAGIGLVLVPSADPAPEGGIGRLFSRNGAAAVVEPWVNRIADISTRLVLDVGGRTVSTAHHRALNNRAGVYFGNMFESGDPVLEKWRSRLDAGAMAVSEELHAEGYFGPAGLDWIVYTDDSTGDEACALVDINARQPMSFVAYCLRERLPAAGHCSFHLAPRRRYPGLTDYGSWYRGCGRNAYDPDRSTGILLCTPLSYTVGQVRHRPMRHGFFIVANTRGEMLEYDRRLRTAFGKA